MAKPVLCPPTPVGLALGALLRLFGADGADARLDEVFEPQFLDAVGRDRILGMMEDVGAATLVSVAEVSPHEVNARVRAEAGAVARMRVVVTPALPHRIAGLLVSPEDGRTGVPFDELVPPPTTVHLASLAGGEDVAAAVLGHLEALVASKQVTGLSAAIVQRGRIVLHASVGWGGLDPRRPVEARSVFRAYSITKLVTAVAVLQLWEQEQFDLDDPVNDHLRSMRIDGPGRMVTIRDLLSHRSGLGSVGSELLWARQAAPAATVLGPVVDAPSRPGALVYSNAGYGVLSQLVADLAGRPFEEQVQDQILGPLGMHSSELRRSDPPGEQFVQGHDVAFDEVSPAPTEVAALLGSGGLFTTAPDLAAFALAVIGGGANGAGRVLSPETMALATSPAGAKSRVGLGFHLAKVAGDRCVWHNGGGHGHSAMVGIVPARGAAVALLTNTAGRTGTKGGIEEDVLLLLREVIADGR